MSEKIAIIFTPKQGDDTRQICNLDDGEPLNASAILRRMKKVGQGRLDCSTGSLRQRALKLEKRLDALEERKRNQKTKS